ncbi:MAG: lipocalin family protein [Verrucomicrobiota bacterium]
MKSKLRNRLVKFIIPTCGALAIGVVGCRMLTGTGKSGELQAMSRKVDLKRFMGEWYVIGNIPVFVEKDAYNAKETYELAEDGTIATTFTFNKGGFDGPQKTMHPKGSVYNKETNAEWRMQFIWPVKSAYLITYLSEDYQTTIVGVPDRKYAWIMARTKTLPDAFYQELVAELKRQGHDVSKLRKVPQR